MPKKKSAGMTKRTTLRKKKASFITFKFSHPVVIIGIGFLLFLAITNIQTTQSLTANAQNILGENEENEEQKKAEEATQEAMKQAEESQKESVKQTEEQQKQQGDQQREAAKTTNSNTSGSSDLFGKSKTEIVTPNGLKMKTEAEGNKQETEIETAGGQKIKTKIEDDGTTKIEAENGTVKLKYRVENGQILLKAESELGEEVELEKNELEKLENAVEDELEQEDIELQPTTDNKLIFTKNQVAALTDFPLSINVTTKQLIVTTPTGQKIVTVLPDEAVQNLLATGIINKVETSFIDSQTQGQLGDLTGVVELEIRNDEVVYKIDGAKTHRVLGFIPITTPVTAFVSADTGEAIVKQQSILTNVIDLLSP